MKRTEILQEVRKMRFEEAYEGWRRGRLTQEEAARLLGVCDRTFRRYLNRYEDKGMEGLIDQRLGQVSHRSAPVDEIVALSDLYSHRYRGFNAKHFYSWYLKGYLLKSGEEGLAHTSEGVIMEAASAYYIVLKVERELEIKDADLKRGVERRRVAQARFDVGEVTKATVLRAEAEVAGIEAAVRGVNKDLAVSQERLSRLVGIPVGFKVEEPVEIAVPGTGTGGIDGLIEIALSRRSDYLKAKADEEIAREGIRYARGGFMPTMRLEGIYSWRDQEPVTSLFFNKESIFATLTLSLPLYEGGLRVAEVREAGSKSREAELRRVILRKDIELQVREAYYSIEALNSTLEFYQKQLLFAEENYNMVFKQFTYGLATNVDVIDANSVLVAAQESFANSKIDLQLAILELKRRMGVLMEEMENPAYQ